MAKQIQYVCDGCGTPKGSTNHWFSLIIKAGLIQIYYSQELLDIDGAIHLCGERCLQRKISETVAQPPSILERTA
jgi:hypothetical protein